jgi:hypothetical protein
MGHRNPGVLGQGDLFGFMQRQTERFISGMREEN